MKAPRIPKNESERLRALEGYRVMDTEPETGFDDITTLVARILDVPISLVSLVDAERQWFKSRYGLEAPETPRELSFCGHVVAEQELLVVPDAFMDERFHDNPLVTGEPRVRFYAGFPLTTPDGHVLGTLCAIDSEPRKISQKQLDTLRILGRQVADQLELRRQVILRKDYEQLLEKTKLLPAIIDFDGYFRRINHSWSQVLGYTEHELMSRPFVELVHEDDVRSTRQAAARLAASSREVTQFTNRLRCADGNYRWLFWHATSDLAGGRIYAVAHDDTERKEAEFRTRDALENLAHSEESLRTLFETAVEAIVTVDDTGIIDRANAVVSRVFGYHASELVGRHIEMLMPPKQRESFHRYLRSHPPESLAEREVVSKEAVAMRKDGTTFPVEISVSEMRIGRRRMFTGIVRDITERKRIDRLKSEFVSTVSHELRTPLTSIRGALGLLAGGRVGEMSDKAKEMVNIALNNSERLVRLINDILDIEKIRSGRLEFDLKELNIDAVVEEAVAANQGFAVEHETEIVVVGPLASVRVHADPDRLAQVFANLISNAAKFSPTGRPIELSVETVNEHVRIGVRDWGPGVPEDFEERLFERFAQADGSDSRRTSGTGLGLSITKAIVERMDGAIGYEPAEGGGSFFYFELPIVRPSVLIPPSAPPRILVCEDEPDIALLLKKTLGFEGYDVDIAKDLGGAKALLAANDYDAVTLDTELGDEDGLELLDEIRETDSSMPVVVVAANGEEARQTPNGGNVNIVDWITKPLDPARLLTFLRGATKTARRTRILHVEDDASLAAIVKALLGDLGDLTNARSLREAKEHLAQSSFDLVLLDIGLPDGEGTELLPFLGTAPVVIFSAAERQPAASERVVATLVKSRATERDLRNAINSALPAAS